MRTVPTDEVTLTLMTLATLLLPQPLDDTTQMAASQMPRRLVILRNLIPTISPTQWRSAKSPLALELSILRKKSFVPVDSGLAPHRRS
jgi:hypothetical protein